MDKNMKNISVFDYDIVESCGIIYANFTKEEKIWL